MVVVEEPVDILSRLDDLDTEERNNSVVGRAFYFVKNMFQLSDDVLDGNFTQDADEPPSSANERPHRPSRKLLSTTYDASSIVSNDVNNYEFDLFLGESDNELSRLSLGDLSLTSSSLSKRQLLSVKATSRPSSAKPSTAKEKKTTSSADGNKPKVGWSYRYRISRYLDEATTKRAGGKSKLTAKKATSSNDNKLSKRKLLELDPNDELSLDHVDDL